MVIFTALPPGTSTDKGRILVDESDYQGVEDEQPPFEIKDVVRIRANEKFSKYYECMDELGEGKFGKVYRCREKATGLQLAAKRIKIKRDADREKVEREVAIMTQLRHPRIAQIYDAFATPENDIVLVMEIVNGGELFDRVVDENYILTELAVVMIVCQLCEAISYIHSKNIVHLDVKPENIMCVSQTGNRIKLIDFGLAQFYDGSSNLLFMAGTPEFVAPEVIKFEPIDFHTDMWSIGVITYILLSGISPFLGETLGDTYVAVEKGEWEFDDEAFEGISEAAKDFISKLLIMDQKKRMLPDDCLNHPWVVGSRTKAANDLILNAPNVGTPLSKEGLKCYLRNKRFRKATWALVFLIRFKRRTLMSFGRQEIPTQMVELQNDAPLPAASQAESDPAFERKRDAVADDQLILEERKISIDIPITIEGEVDGIACKVELATTTKHQEEKKLSSEIPKKKLKGSTAGIENATMKKKAKKHKEQRTGKSDELPSRPKKVHKREQTKISFGQQLEAQEKKSTTTTQETVSSERRSTGKTGAQDEECEKPMPVKSELCVVLETQPSEISFSGSKLAESKDNEKAEVIKRKSSASPSLSSRTSQELTGRSGSFNKLSEINKKGSSVAAILSMFSEKAEQAARRFERRPSRPVRTFRDVEKPSSRKASITSPIQEDETSCVKPLYRAPEEEKERVKNIIELHRRGSADRKQVETQEIVAVKHEEILRNSKRGESEGTKGKESGQQEVEGKISVKRRKQSVVDAAKEKSRKRGVAAKVVVPGLPIPELNVVVDSSQEMKSAVGMNNMMESSRRDETSEKRVVEGTHHGLIAEENRGPATGRKILGLNTTVDSSSMGQVFQGPLQFQEKEQVGDAVTVRKVATLGSKILENLVEGKKEVKLSEARSVTSVNSKSTSVGLEIRHTGGTENRNKDSTITETVTGKKTRRSNSKKLPKLHSDKDTMKKVVEETNEKKENRSGRKASENEFSGGDVVKASGNTAAVKLRERVVRAVPENVGKVRSTSLASAQTKKLKEIVSAPAVTEGERCSLAQRPTSYGDISSGSKAVGDSSSGGDGDSYKLKSTSALRSLSPNVNRLIENAGNLLREGRISERTHRKPPKTPGTSKRTKVAGGRKVDAFGDESKSCTKSVAKTHEDVNKKVLHTGDANSNMSPSDTATVSKVRKQNSSSVEIPSFDATIKRKLLRKSSFPKNSLMKIRSEINLAERTRDALSDQLDTVRLRRKAVDDEAALNRMKGNRHSITVASLKHQENFSFGWLKLQLETRVSKDQAEQTTWRPRRGLQISPFQTGNAQKALNMWKTMEQRCIANT